jgi:hypothetical protein
MGVLIGVPMLALGGLGLVSCLGLAETIPWTEEARGATALAFSVAFTGLGAWLFFPGLVRALAGRSVHGHPEPWRVDRRWSPSHVRDASGWAVFNKAFHLLPFLLAVGLFLVPAAGSEDKTALYAMLVAFVLPLFLLFGFVLREALRALRLRGARILLPSFPLWTGDSQTLRLQGGHLLAGYSGSAVLRCVQEELVSSEERGSSRTAGTRRSSSLRRFAVQEHHQGLTFDGTGQASLTFQVPAEALGNQLHEEGDTPVTYWELEVSAEREDSMAYQGLFVLPIYRRPAAARPSTEADPTALTG